MKISNELKQENNIHYLVITTLVKKKYELSKESRDIINEYHQLYYSFQIIFEGTKNVDNKVISDDVIYSDYEIEWMDAYTDEYGQKQSKYMHSTIQSYSESKL